MLIHHSYKVYISKFTTLLNSELKHFNLITYTISLNYNAIIKKLRDFHSHYYSQYYFFKLLNCGYCSQNFFFLHFSFNCGGHISGSFKCFFDKHKYKELSKQTCKKF